MSKPLTIAMVAGEASGDLLGAGLVREIKKAYPGARCYGIGGPKMIAEGFESLFPMERLSVMGLVEVLGRLWELMGIRKQLRNTLLADRPDGFIGIDAPDFNLALERRLKSQGIPTVHYVSPQVWAWRESRLKKIQRSVDHMLCLLPFEADYYQGHGVPVTFVGHPLADQVPVNPDKTAARQSLRVAESGPVMAILPGSRKTEVEHLGSLFLETAREVRKSIPNIRFLIPAANPRRKQQLLSILENYPDLDIALTDGRASEVMAGSDAILIASGTATLEAALHKRPMVISYRMSSISFAIISRLVKVKYVGLPNLLSEHPMVPELLQDDATVENLSNAMLKALRDTQWSQAMTANFADIHNTLKRDASVLSWQAIQTVIGKHHDSRE